MDTPPKKIKKTPKIVKMPRRADLPVRLPPLELRSFRETEELRQFTKSFKLRVIRPHLGGGSAAGKTQKQDIHQNLMKK